MQMELDKKKAVSILKDKIDINNVVMYGYRGSIAHGTFIPNEDPNSIDDIDVMGVYLAPMEYYVGLGRGNRYQRGWDFWVDEYDCVFYEFRKFINLLLGSNPNVLSMLWMQPEHHIVVNDWTKMLIENRDAFMSKRIATTFIGYAEGQMKRMTKFSTQGYMGEKRKNLVEKYGYDIKNAAHVVRLLKTGIEALKTGRIEVFRSKDAALIIDIKTGKWPIERVKDEANKLFEEARKAGKETSLPEKPDYDRVEEICKYILIPYVTEKYTEQLVKTLQAK